MTMRHQRIVAGCTGSASSAPRATRAPSCFGWSPPIPALELAWATGDTQAGNRVAALYPSLAAAYPSLTFSHYDPAAADGLDLVFCGLPHGESQQLMPELRKRVQPGGRPGRRLPPARPGASTGSGTARPTSAPTCSPTSRTGCPSCSAPTSWPPTRWPPRAATRPRPRSRWRRWWQAGVIEPEGVIVDAASGVSGAGRGLKHTTHFGTANEDFTAYGLLDHRHTPEIEQASGASVLFTPHLAPMTRGILATCYARPRGAPSTAALLELLHARYDGEPFVVVSDEPPSTKATWGSNTAHLTARFDARTGWVVVLCAIDNLVKGASGQAMQCANLLLGLDETTGLAAVGVYP